MKKIAVPFHIVVGLALFCAISSACSSTPNTDPPTAKSTSTQAAAPADDLDAAIRETSDYLNNQLQKGNKLLILNFQSEFPALSEYIIDELIANTVNDRVFTVVDRQQLDTIRAELGFQMSGEVDDKTAQALGRMAGAQIIISGAVSQIGDIYRLRVRALSVQYAQIEGQFNRNIPNSTIISALVKSKATGYGGSTAQQGTSATTATPEGYELLNGDWDSGQYVVTFSNGTGVFKDLYADMWLRAKNAGRIAIGEQCYRNIVKSGDRQWSGNIRLYNYNSPYQTLEWPKFTMTLSADGQTLDMGGWHLRRMK